MFCFSGSMIILVSKIRHYHSNLVACSWTCTDKQCVLAKYRVEFWHDFQICEFPFLQNGMTTIKYIKRNIYTNAWTDTVYISEKETMTKEKSHCKFFVAWDSCCWSEDFQKSAWRIIYPHGNLSLDWHQEHTLLYFRVDSQPTWTVIAPLKPIGLWQYIYTEILYTSVGSKSQITTVISRL